MTGGWFLGNAITRAQPPSLHFRDSVSGGIAVKCHAGCDHDSAREALFRMAGVTETVSTEQPPPSANQSPSVDSAQRMQEQKYREAAGLAGRLVMSASRGSHDYFLGHGITYTDHEGFVGAKDVLICSGVDYGNGNILYRDWMMVPVYNYRTDAIQTVQFIPPPSIDESKKFLGGGRAKHGVHKLGSRGPSDDLWLVEGYATGKSVLNALKPLSIPVAVWVCFSANGILQIANGVAKTRKRIFAVADHDLWTCKGCKERWDGEGDTCPACGSDDLVEPTGEKYARESHLPYWMPPTPGDANDYMLDNGIAELTNALSRFRAENI